MRIQCFLGLHYSKCNILEFKTVDWTKQDKKIIITCSPTSTGPFSHNSQWKSAIISCILAAKPSYKTHYPICTVCSWNWDSAILVKKLHMGVFWLFLNLTRADNGSEGGVGHSNGSSIGVWVCLFLLTRSILCMNTLAFNGYKKSTTKTVQLSCTMTWMNLVGASFYWKLSCSFCDSMYQDLYGNCPEP